MRRAALNRHGLGEIVSSELESLDPLDAICVDPIERPDRFAAIDAETERIWGPYRDEQDSIAFNIEDN